MRGLGGEGSRLLTPRQAKGAAALLFRQPQLDQDQETKSIHSVNFVSMSHHWVSLSLRLIFYKNGSTPYNIYTLLSTQSI